MNMVQASNPESQLQISSVELRQEASQRQSEGGEIALATAVISNDYSKIRSADSHRESISQPDRSVRHKSRPAITSSQSHLSKRSFAMERWLASPLLKGGIEPPDDSTLEERGQHLTEKFCGKRHSESIEEVVSSAAEMLSTFPQSEPSSPTLETRYVEV